MNSPNAIVEANRQNDMFSQSLKNSNSVKFTTVLTIT